MKNTVLNLDANATYGLLPEVEEKLRKGGLSLFNPSSIHSLGQLSRMMLETARDSIRQLLGLSRDGSVIFTSGATESNNAAILSPFISYLSVAERKSSIVPGLVISAVEHPSVLEPAKRLKEMGVAVSIVSPRSDGTFSPGDFAACITDSTKLVSVMLVNNETGQLLPVAEITKAVKAKNPRTLVHCDAVQALGKMDLSPETLPVDMLSISGHKIGSLSGIGALILNNGVGIDPAIIGGPQETRRRAGTENLLGAVSFGYAALIAKREFPERRLQMIKNAALVKERLSSLTSKVVFNFDGIETVGNTLSLRVPGVNNGDLVVALDLEGVCVSTGSACASGKPEVSAVLKAMHLTDDAASQTIRISLMAEYDHQTLENGLIRTAEVIKRFIEK